MREFQNRFATTFQMPDAPGFRSLLTVGRDQHRPTIHSQLAILSAIGPVVSPCTPIPKSTVDTATATTKDSSLPPRDVTGPSPHLPAAAVVGRGQVILCTNWHAFMPSGFDFHGTFPCKDNQLFLLNVAASSKYRSNFSD